MGPGGLGLEFLHGFQPLLHQLDSRGHAHVGVGNFLAAGEIVISKLGHGVCPGSWRCHGFSLGRLGCLGSVLMLRDILFFRGRRICWRCFFVRYVRGVHGRRRRQASAGVGLYVCSGQGDAHELFAGLFHRILPGREIRINTLGCKKAQHPAQIFNARFFACGGVHGHDQGIPAFEDGFCQSCKYILGAHLKEDAHSVQVHGFDFLDEVDWVQELVAQELSGLCRVLGIGSARGVGIDRDFRLLEGD